METMFNHNFEFIAPSGAKYVIREQNGNDDDILSNPSTSRNLMNLSHFISAIVVDQDFYPHSGTISVEEALDLPSNDRYAILINSRIHSIGNILEFTHDWGGTLGKVEYEQDLNEFIFNKPLEEITEEDLNSKPDAIPLYPMGTKTFEGNCGDKNFTFDVLTGRGEQYIIELPLDKRTKNQSLIARNLKLKVNSQYEKVTNFRMFSVKDLQNIRKQIAAVDPEFSGNIKIHHPSNPEITDYVNILALPGFFWPEEIG